MAKFIQAFLSAVLLLAVMALLACASNGLRAGESTGVYLPLVTKPLLPLIRRVSVANDGDQSNGLSSWPSISADGRFVAFESLATNLVIDDTNEVADIFVHDWQTGETVRVSVCSDGTQASDSSYRPSISADGRYVAFTSWANNLVGDDTNTTEDVFVHDRQTGETTRVSVVSDGTEANDLSAEPAISGDGRFVTFLSFASNLVADDKNKEGDVFVHDRPTGGTTRVSVASDGSEPNDHSIQPSISGDGRQVAFESWASNLVGDDANSTSDIFVHDQLTSITTRVSVASDGVDGKEGSVENSISADGRILAFELAASDLVAGDTNAGRDVFVRELAADLTIRISVAEDGSQANSDSFQPSISGDGRNVAFESVASNLVSNDSNGTGDIFVYEHSLLSLGYR